MRVTITIQCDNAAFDLVPGLEVARILKDYAAELYDTPQSTRLYDVNGNRVGQVTVTGASRRRVG